MALRPGRFVERLPFTTTPIRRLAGIATDLGLLERAGEGPGASLRIASVVCAAGEEAAAVAELRRRAGADLPVAERLLRQDPPREAELAVLRSYDPKRVLLA